jgi:hypothetical protein
VLTSSPREFAKSSAVLTKSIYPFPRRSPECALGHRSFALHVSTMTLPGTSVNAGNKGNDANQIRD